MGTYYYMDTMGMSFTELWRISSSFRVFRKACVRKVFRKRLPFLGTAIRYDESITVLPAEEVPAHARRVLAPLIEGFQKLGARFAFYHTLPTTRKLKSYFAILLPPEQNAINVIAWTEVGISKTIKVSPPICALTSHLQDGTFFSTTDRPKKRENKPPEFKGLYCRGATPAELIRRHKEALAKCDLQPVTVRNEEDAKKIQIEIKRRNFEWNVSRGVFVILTPAEKATFGIGDEEAR